jgi:thiosulfate/3-mercaptopyruvate sulfurtransferase
MRRLLNSLAVAAAVLFAGPSFAQPLVDSEWLKGNLDKPNVVVLDVTGRTQDQYKAGHVPGAVFTDYAKDGWRVNVNGVAGKVPPAANLEKLIGSLGIDNNTHVILVPLGERALDMGAATRIYWTFKVVGHDKISILDGGFTDWAKIDPKTKQRVYQLATGGTTPQAKTFKANLREEMLVSTADIQKALANNVPLVDNRPNDFYVGISVSPAATRAGTIPGAKNVQESFITKNGGGSFRSAAQLKQIFASQGVPSEGEQISFCNTGHWASLGWFAAHELMGNKKAKMYDGSMSEWSRGKDLPVEQKVKLD